MLCRRPKPFLSVQVKANIEKKDILLLGVTMTLFGLKLAQVENRIFANIKKTKSAFPGRNSNNGIRSCFNA